MTALALLAQVSARAVQSVVLSWNPSSDTAVAGYKVYCGGASQAYTNVMDAGNTTNVTISGLAEGSTNYFSATTYDASTNESTYSVEVMFVAPAATNTTQNVPIGQQQTNPPPVITPPVLNMVGGLAVTANPTNANSVIVSWNASRDVGATGYFVYYGTTSLNYTNVTDAGSATNLTIYGLSSGCTNYFAVTEYDAATNQSDYSNEVSFVTSVPPPVVVPVVPILNPVSGLTASANPANAGSAILSWTASTDAGVAGYQIFTGIASGNYSQSQNVGLVTNLTVTGLTPGITYYFAIREYDAAWNQSDVSPEITWLPPLPVNTPPTLNALTNIPALNMNAPQQNIALAGITSGSASESQKLKVTAKSSNTALIPNPTITYTSPAKKGTLSFKPANNQTGTATITVTVNDGGTNNNLVTQSFTVTVINKALLAALPKISKQVKGGRVLKGKPVTLAVIVTGQAPFKYQWKFNGTNLPGATAATLTLTKPVMANGGTYSVKISNNAGSTNSAVAQLVVLTNTTPTISAPVNSGGQFSFQVAGVDGSKYVVAATTDFQTWTPVQTNTAPFTFTEANVGSNDKRFYSSYYLP